MTDKRTVNLILASASPRRRDLLSKIVPSWPFEFEYSIKASNYEESLPIQLTPAETTMYLSLRKAQEVASRQGIAPSSIVIGSDTIVEVDGQIYGKPRNEEDAFRMLKSLSARSHNVISGLAVIVVGKGIKKVSFDSTEVKLKALSDQDIWDYIKTGEPMDKAGAYAIQGIFAKYIDGFCGSYNNVVGLPTELLNKTLAEILENLD